ncbi:unnamed protein product [Paramecium sonneborni]|uniref:Uncharacterized protein n=1 Tax=Paramecium sonneborni TaxID=65129 RepID=A0A8S1PM03_9CILI|nr:unnamed protein product [Paramecium sonneborni]
MGYYPSVTLTVKTQLAPKIIQIFWFALNILIEQNQKGSHPERNNSNSEKKQYFDIQTLKQEAKVQIILSDWQLLLLEFEQFITNKKQQNQKCQFQNKQIKHNRICEYLKKILGQILLILYETFILFFKQMDLLIKMNLQEGVNN